MHFLIGWVIGERIARGADEINSQSGGALVGIVLWLLIPNAIGLAARNNLGEWSAYPAFIVTVLAMLAFVSWKPLNSKFKMMMLFSIAFCAVLAFYISGIWLAVLFGYPILTGELSKSGISAIAHSGIIQPLIIFALSYGIRKVVEGIFNIHHRQLDKLEGQAGEF